jgi:polar amino acid transport system substrate-binding protein
MGGPRRAGAICAALALAATLGLGACGEAKDRAQATFRPGTEGVLRVAADLPAPGFWDGDDPATVAAGFEWGLAAALADELDLELEVVQVPFPQIVDEGDLAGADLALAEISRTSARQQVLELSDPYYTTGLGVVRVAGETVPDLKAARELVWAVREDTTSEDFVDEVVRPTDEVVVVASELDAVAAVRDGRADAALMDTTEALVLANDSDDMEVVAAFVSPQHYVAGLPKGSPNVESVNRALRALAANGTLEELSEDYLIPRFGQRPEDIPVIRSR